MIKFLVQSWYFQNTIWRRMCDEVTCCFSTLICTMEMPPSADGSIPAYRLLRTLVDTRPWANMGICLLGVREHEFENCCEPRLLTSQRAPVPNPGSQVSIIMLADPARNSKRCQVHALAHDLLLSSPTRFATLGLELFQRWDRHGIPV